MDEKVKDDEKKVILVEDAKDGKLKAVKEIDKEGKPRMVEPTEKNLADLLAVNTNDPALEAFFRKFMEEARKDVGMGLPDIFIMGKDVLVSLIKADFAQALLEHFRADPAKLGEVPAFEPMDLTKIDTTDMERKGIRMEDLEPYLKAMSYGHKSHGMIEMHPEMGENGLRVTTRGRVSLEEQADGTLKVIPHYYREKCDLDSPFHGVLLDDEAKRNITETRHAGKVIDLELEPGKMTPCFVSRDKYTNELVAMPVSEFDKRDTIKNAPLSEGKQLDLYSGGRVLLEGYTTRSGFMRDAYIQVDAAERNFEFDHRGLDQRRYQEHNRAVYRQKLAEQGTPLPDGPRGLFVPRRIFGVPVPEHAFNQWQEAVNFPEKQGDVKAIFMRGLQMPSSPAPLDRWVKPSFTENKIRFYRWNPDYVRKQDANAAQAQKPADGSPGQAAGQPKQEQPAKQAQQQRQAATRSRQVRSKGVGGL